MTDRKDEFFVGYFPMPERLGRFCKVLVVVLLLLGAGFSYWVSSSQKSAGQGQWQVTATETHSGYLTVDPYPILHTSDANPRSIMLMLQGKKSAKSIAAALAGQHVSVTGFPIGRGGWMSLELRNAQDIVTSVAPEDAALPTVETLEQVQLSGEVVDTKCFIGVMKPGAGKVHRACAALCVAGGIPPMLVVTQNDGNRYGYLLVDNAGETAAEEVTESIAVPVQVTGQLERRGDLTYLRIAPNGVQRI